MRAKACGAVEAAPAQCWHCPFAPCRSTLPISRSSRVFPHVCVLLRVCAGAGIGSARFAGMSSAPHPGGDGGGGNGKKQSGSGTKRGAVAAALDRDDPAAAAASTSSGGAAAQTLKRLRRGTDVARDEAARQRLAAIRRLCSAVGTVCRGADVIIVLAADGATPLFLQRDAHSDIIYSVLAVHQGELAGRFNRQYTKVIFVHSGASIQAVENDAEDFEFTARSMASVTLQLFAAIAGTTNNIHGTGPEFVALLPPNTGAPANKDHVRHSLQFVDDSFTAWGQQHSDNKAIPRKVLSLDAAHLRAICKKHGAGVPIAKEEYKNLKDHASAFTDSDASAAAAAPQLQQASSAAAAAASAAAAAAASAAAALGAGAAAQLPADAAAAAPAAPVAPSIAAVRSVVRRRAAAELDQEAKAEVKAVTAELARAKNRLRALRAAAAAGLPPPSFAGWLYIANDTLGQFRPAGYQHRYEIGFSEDPESRVRNFFTHNLDARWLMAIPVTDCESANDVALQAVRDHIAIAARIIPGRVKWFWANVHAPTALILQTVQQALQAANLINLALAGPAPFNFLGAGPAAAVQQLMNSDYTPQANGLAAHANAQGHAYLNGDVFLGPAVAQHAGPPPAPVAAAPAAPAPPPAALPAHAAPASGAGAKRSA